MILGLALTGIGIYAVTRRRDGDPAAVAPEGSPVERRNRILLEVARLDEALEAARGAEAERLEVRRAELLARLREPA